MDTLVALSTAISFLFSTFNTFWGEAFWTARGIENHTYFDASVMIITFVLTGRLLEEKAKHSTASSIRSLMGLTPKTAHLVDGDETTDIPIAAVQRGDTIEVRGTLKSYSGHSLAAAGIRYTVMGGGQEVREGILHPDRDGRFAIRFASGQEQYLYYNIRVSVSDSTGETLEWNTGRQVRRMIPFSVNLV